MYRRTAIKISSPKKSLEPDIGQQLPFSSHSVPQSIRLRIMSHLSWATGHLELRVVRHLTQNLRRGEGELCTPEVMLPQHLARTQDISTVCGTRHRSLPQRVVGSGSEVRSSRALINKIPSESKVFAQFLASQMSRWKNMDIIADKKTKPGLGLPSCMLAGTLPCGVSEYGVPAEHHTVPGWT